MLHGVRVDDIVAANPHKPRQMLATGEIVFASLEAGEDIAVPNSLGDPATKERISVVRARWGAQVGSIPSGVYLVPQNGELPPSSWDAQIGPDGSVQFVALLPMQMGISASKTMNVPAGTIIPPTILSYSMTLVGAALNPIGIPQPSAPNGCFQGQVLNAQGMCVSAASWSCPAGQVLNAQNICVPAYDGGACPAGQQLQNGRCVPVRAGGTQRIGGSSNSYAGMTQGAPGSLGEPVARPRTLAGIGDSCMTNADCSGGASCILGFCGPTIPFPGVPGNGVPVQPVPVYPSTGMTGTAVAPAMPPYVAPWTFQTRPTALYALMPLLIGTTIAGRPAYVILSPGQALPGGSWYATQAGGAWTIQLAYGIVALKNGSKIGDCLGAGTLTQGIIFGNVFSLTPVKFGPTAGSR